MEIRLTSVRRFRLRRKAVRGASAADQTNEDFSALSAPPAALPGKRGAFAWLRRAARSPVISWPCMANVTLVNPASKPMTTAEALLRHPHVYPHQGVPYSRSLQGLFADLRARGGRIVFTNGCFDILHPGHVDLLARARDLGDALVLGLNSDESVRRQRKGPERPVNPFAARAFVLAHLASVDAVVEFVEDTPLELVAALVPQVLVKGGDWTPENIVGRDVVEKNGGKVYSLPLLPGFSTTGLIAKIRSGI
jgi:rfaE bifunctional protein nucleotidyltransferase chain/domain